MRKGRVGRRNLQGDRLTDKLQARIAHQSAWQQSGFGEYLKTIADAQYQPALLRKFLDRTHHRRELGNRPATQIVSIGKSAGKDNQIRTLKRYGIVPQKHRVLPERLRKGVPGVVIAIAAWEDDNADFHARSLRSGGCRSRGLLPAGASFFHGGLPIALFQGRQDDRCDELLLAMIVEFNHNVVVVRRNHRAETELSMLDLGSLGERWFVGHESAEVP